MLDDLERIGVPGVVAAYRDAGDRRPRQLLGGIDNVFHRGLESLDAVVAQKLMTRRSAATQPANCDRKSPKRSRELRVLCSNTSTIS